MMLKKITKYTLLLLPLLAFVACDDNEPRGNAIEGDEPASLVMEVSAPNVMVESRAIGTDLAYPDPTNDWEMVVDGQRIYDVFILLLKKVDAVYNMVGYREFTRNQANYEAGNGINDEGTAIKMQFLYDDPVNGNSERLKRGSYRVIFIANYGPFNTYEGLNNASNRKFVDVVNAIKTKFQTESDSNTNVVYKDNESGMPFVYDNNHEFFHYEHAAGDDGVCPMEPMPLTASIDVDLEAGMNTLSKKILKRTRSRITIEVENRSSVQPLSVKGLSFGRIAQQDAYIFENPDDENFIYTNGANPRTTVNINPLSTDAIVQFTATLSDPIVLAKSTEDGNKRVVFDAYILESKINGAYTFHPVLEYDGLTDYVRVKYNGAAEIKTANDFATSYNSKVDAPYYIVKSAHGNWYLCAPKDNSEGNSVYVKAVADLNADAGQFILSGSSKKPLLYMWKFQKVEGKSNSYQLQNAGTGQFLGVPTGNNVLVPMLNSDNLQGLYFQLYNFHSYISFAGKKADGTNSGSYYYLDNYSSNNPYSPNGTQIGNKVSGWTDVSATGGGRWSIIPLATEKGARFDNTVFMEYITEQSHVFPLTNIKRNQHYRMLISTSYEQHNGHLYFDVTPWTHKNNEIKFD